MIETLDQLDATVGARPETAMLKSIPLLDEHCEAILARSPFAVATVFGASDSVRSITFGGEPGVLRPLDPKTLALGGAEPGALEGIDDGAAIGMIVLVPGYGETLRINGRVRLGDVPVLAVEEAFLHCAKAIIRSGLWGEPPAAVPDDVDSFLASVPFVLIGSIDASGAADVSPKGDPAGLLHRLGATRFAIADRPGNQRTDTLHNLLESPRVALVAMLPGDARIAELHGTASISADADLLAELSLRGKTPKAAIVIDVDHTELRDPATISAASLWDPTRHLEPGTFPRAVKIWSDHLAVNIVDETFRNYIVSDEHHEAFQEGLDNSYRNDL